MTNGTQIPPENDPNEEGDGFPEFGGEETVDESALNKGTPAVSAAPGKALVVIIILVGAVAFFVITSLLTDDGSTDKEDKEKEYRPPPEAPLLEIPNEPLDAPEPAPPPPTAVIPPPPPVEPPPISDIPEIEARDEALWARRQSDSVIFKGKGNFFGLGKDDKDKRSGRQDFNDPNTAFANSVTPSEAPRVEAQRMGDLHTMIAQGKMIDTVLETAINTDLPGTLRAIVSHDVYGEAGNAVLIPKGSRLIGTYNTGILRGQDRVFIVWTRVIRPDGIDVMIGSEATDNLGRSGIKGIVDNKFMEVFTSAILTSAVTLGVASVVSENVDNSTVTSTTYNSGSTQEAGDPTALAARELVGTLGGTAREFIDQYIDLRPTIYIHQGTSMKVFVNRDLIFPDDVLQTVHMIP